MKSENNPFKEIEYFEQELAEFCGSRYCCAVDSCTSGLFLVLRYFKCKKERIIFPRKTYLSMPMMALATENVVIFKDFEWSGIYPIEIVSKPEIKLFDSAKRLKRNDFIKNSIMLKSFHMKKHITSISGKGGAILTDDKDLYEWCVRARWEGRLPYTDYKDPKQNISIIGFNMNLTPEEAVFLRRQLQTCEDNASDLEELNGYRNLDEFEVFINSKVLDSNGMLIKAGRNKINQEIFDIRRKAVHGDRYICLDPYQKMSSKLRFECFHHGIFFQRAQAHLLGQGCPKCNSKPKKNLTYLHFLASQNKGKCLSTEYFNMNHDYSWECQCGNIWNASGSEIKQGNWCPKCRYVTVSKKNTKINGFEYLQKLASQNFGKCLAEIYTKITNKYPWECKRGHVFYSRASDVTQGKWCKKCNESKGERSIDYILSNINVKFEREFIFEDCKDIKPLPFDFYLPDYNLCIEFDGSQHFKQPTGYWKNCNMTQIQFRDEIKNKYCQKNGIHLIRIPYTAYKKLGEIILTEYENGFNRTLNLSNQKKEIDETRTKIN